MHTNFLEKQNIKRSFNTESIENKEIIIKNNDVFKIKNKPFLVDKLDPVAPYPKRALIEISNACNHRCLFCHNQDMKRKIGKLDIKTYKKFVHEVASLGLDEIGLYTTGEPFINRDLHIYINLAKKIGIKRIYLTTNGSLANVEYVEKCINNGLNSIKLSINAGDKETYKLIHGKDDWDKLLKNVKDIHELKIRKYNKLELFCSCIITGLSEPNDLMDKHRTIFNKYFNFIGYYPVQTQGGRNNYKINKLSLEKDKISNIQIKLEDKSNCCNMLWNRWHLTCEGYLTCCCVDYENDLVYGDINYKSAAEEWNNKLMQDLRLKHINNTTHGTICYNCIYGKDEKYRPVSTIGK